MTADCDAPLPIQVLEVKKSQVGAFVRVQAECRIAVKHVSQAQPYIRGTVVALPDEPLQDRQRVSQQLEQLRSTMQVATDDDVSLSQHRPRCH